MTCVCFGTKEEVESVVADLVSHIVLSVQAHSSQRLSTSISYDYDAKRLILLIVLHIANQLRIVFLVHKT